MILLFLVIAIYRESEALCIVETQLTEAKGEMEFLFALYASSRAEEVALWAWPKEQQQQFLHMQHKAQQQFYQQQYPGMRYRILLADGKKAGRVAIVQLAEELVLVDIILLPEFQNKGLGSQVLQDLQRDAAEKNLPVRLSVFTGSPAQRLYERFGFQTVSASGVYTTMKWAPVREAIKG
jgi:ribosomal protein S18 acetylase RimI-like enzyme